MSSKVVNYFKNQKRKSEDFKNYGQFERKIENSYNNYSPMKEVLNTPLRNTEISTNKSGKFLYTKEGTLKRKLKTN
jgi:hypothetical protein